jgi:hypothetical protein
MHKVKLALLILHFDRFWQDESHLIHEGLVICRHTTHATQSKNSHKKYRNTPEYLQSALCYIMLIKRVPIIFLIKIITCKILTCFRKSSSCLVVGRSLISSWSPSRTPSCIHNIINALKSISFDNRIHVP